MFYILQTTLVEELGGFDTAAQQQGHQGQVSGSDQLALSPEELLLAVSKIKQERVDTPPVELRGAVGGAAEDSRCVYNKCVCDSCILSLKGL